MLGGWEIGCPTGSPAAVTTGGSELPSSAIERQNVPMFERYRRIQEERATAGDDWGFTLIELLIVIVVLGILAAVVVFALGGVTGTSAQSACNSDAKTVETAVAAEQAAVPLVPLVAISGTGTTAAAVGVLVPT